MNTESNENLASPRDKLTGRSYPLQTVNELVTECEALLQPQKGGTGTAIHAVCGMTLTYERMPTSAEGSVAPNHAYWQAPCLLSTCTSKDVIVYSISGDIKPAGCLARLSMQLPRPNSAPQRIQMLIQGSHRVQMLIQGMPDHCTCGACPTC